MSQEEVVTALKRALARERTARKQAELILEEKATELFAISQELKKSNESLEDLLRERNSELRGVFENIVDAYVVMDLEGNVIKMNHAAEELLGFCLSDQQLNLMSLALEGEQERILKTFERLLQYGSVTNFEVRIKTLHGTEKLVHINASIVLDSRGNPIAGQGIVRDITAIRLLERQKEELVDRLGRSNRELSEYAHVVSHDLKSPLRNIDALVDWIREDNAGKLDDTTLVNFDLIKSTLVKMEGLISGILEYSSASAINEEMSTTDMQIVVDEATELLHIPDHIEIQIDQKLPKVLCHKTKMVQVFQNLIGNAIKYMDKGNGFINIGCQEVDKYHEFSVTDNGPGIEKKHHEIIFRVFQSIRPTDMSNGVGLSIVKKVIESHGGTIWLESEPGTGTTFYFTMKK